MLSVPFNRYKKKSLIALVRIQSDQLDEFLEIKYKKLLQARIEVLRRILVGEKTLEGHTDKVRCLIKLNERQIASGSGDNSIRIWESVDGNCLKTLEGHNKLNASSS